MENLEKYPLLDIKHPARLDLFGEVEFYEFDLYWIVYDAGKLSHNTRLELKQAGWRLQRHSRTNKEMWVFDKVDWKKKVKQDKEYQDKLFDKMYIDMVDGS